MSRVRQVRQVRQVRSARVVAWPAVLVLLALTACGAEAGTADAGQGSAGPPDLADRVFVSTEVTGHDLVPGSEVRLTFLADSVSAVAGCNTHNGGATWDDGTLVVAQPMAMTMMACSPELTDQDDWLARFLGSSPALRLDGSTLTLGDDEEGIVLEEEQQR